MLNDLEAWQIPPVVAVMCRVPMQEEEREEIVRALLTRWLIMLRSQAGREAVVITQTLTHKITSLHLETIRNARKSREKRTMMPKTGSKYVPGRGVPLTSKRFPWPEAAQDSADAVQVDHILSLAVSLGLLPHLVNTAVFTKEVSTSEIDVESRFVGSFQRTFKGISMQMIGFSRLFVAFSAAGGELHGAPL